MSTTSIGRPSGPQETHSGRQPWNNLERPSGPRETNSEGSQRTETFGSCNGGKTKMSRPKWVPRTGPPWGPSQGTREQYSGNNNISTSAKGRLTQRTWVTAGLRPISSRCSTEGKHDTHNLHGEMHANKPPPAPQQKTKKSIDAFFRSVAFKISLEHRSAKIFLRTVCRKNQ